MVGLAGLRGLVQRFRAEGSESEELGYYHFGKKTGPVGEGGESENWGVGVRNPESEDKVRLQVQVHGVVWPGEMGSRLEG